MLTLHYAGFQPHASGFGWATCNANLRRELGKHFTLVEDEVGQAERLCFMPLMDHDFNPASPARGRINFAYTFFEFPLGPNAKTNAAKYDVVFCGSSWCLRRMEEVGITNGEVLIQGVDGDIFNLSGGVEASTQDSNPNAIGNTISHGSMKTCVGPSGIGVEIIGPKSCGSSAPPAQTFRIFSGGKFEYRKGQDLVIAAFKKFAETHPGAHLVCSWFNPWPQLIQQALESNRLACDGRIAPQWYAQPQITLFNALLQINGLRPDQFTILPQLPQEALAREMANTDVGLFPNRCEGGTNLVLMEYAACGGKVVANVETGHADVASAITYPIFATRDAVQWAEQEIKDIVYAIELAYNDHRSVFSPSRRLYPAFTWARTACQIRDAASRSTGVPACGANGHLAR